MSWNYRVMRHRDGSLAVHEVYYDEAGQPRGWTENPASFGVDAEEGLSGLIRMLEFGVVQNRPFLGYTGARRAPAFEGRISTGDVSCAGGGQPPPHQACWG